MSTEVTLPALGESVTEGTVSRWLKEVGEHVDADEPLLEVSTDKVDTEIPSPASGTLLEIKFNEDDVAPVGAVLGIVGEPSEQGSAPAPEQATPTAPAGTVEQAEEAPTPTEPAPAAPAEPSAPAPAGGSSDATEVLLPALGESVTEGTVSRWLKEVGEEVDADEPLLEVSTDKVDTEIPSPAAGVLLEIKVKEDEVAEVGSVLGVVGSPDAAAAAPEPDKGAPASAAPAASVAPTPEPVGAAPAASAAPAAQAPAAPARAAEPTPVAPRATGEDGPYVTPLVRKMAADNGVDLNSITGTGVGGRIRKQDVLDAAEAAKKAAEAPAPAAAAAAPAAAQPSAKPVPDESGKRGTTEKMSRMRTVIASRMVESLQTAAQLTATVEVDLTAISQLRKKVKDEFRRREGTGLTYLAFISKATTEALKAFPNINASIDGKNVVYHDAENLGIAVDTPRGLIVPVIKNAGDLNVGGIAKQIADLASRGRDNQLGPDELSGATFTITNYGSAGTLFDTPVINQPNSGILGTGALVKRPVVVSDQFGNDTIAIRDMMYISLTYDHRLIDGAVAARFLSAVKARLEEGAFGGEFGL
ncbi:2-oxoglutarate dehydrogenase, E2 component, dihydrolipoamide succinyltransferase [Propionimicrobium sp. PCR01-08-3]|uniref:2-oxoglutarate dehydrogenase, E2 component, dihydrolipoamide succinyltransferase n=1 Tax=Propionimicrobium sp. PCR01-08-3 TaxID=3052086 RepID=UPI00255CB74A|nr:2-oxoglutarate dehydrogenase, E2 component, dihydrolipoamide succinyltransferase [Propionimicrobium sp. PCR01-08-3]WIY81695.1 2-oxoglutarate dehydrogenase, E2 component, dihydrolipoamide succinyltransferase [Propionimicrobium sp. PCR01-08-3]